MEQEDKPLDPFFETVRSNVKQARGNAKLREVLAAILGGKPASLTRDETIAIIHMLPEQYEALCRFVGVKPQLTRVDDGPEQQLHSGSEETGGPDLPVQDEGNESGADRSGYDPMEQ